ncbi:MAG: PadR family transcriptional regulator [Candidatus Rariloculaceae bacterium]
MGQSNPPFMSGVPELLVLRLLAHREMYGYELVKAVRVVTGEAIALGEGVIYPVLHGLEKNGALKATRKPVNGRTRVYYCVTTKGQQRLDRLTQEWDRVSSGIQSALGEVGHA